MNCFLRITAEITLTPVQEIRFANTEIKSNILESIRGCNVFIIQDVSNNRYGMSVDDNIRALTTLIDAARVASAKNITVVIPVFPYARQDKIWGRECLTARLVSRELELAGAKQSFLWIFTILQLLVFSRMQFLKIFMLVKPLKTY